MSTSKHKTLETITPTISAQEFFEQYVSKRQPVVMKGFPDDKSFKGSQLQYLSKKAGNVTVMVEPMNSDSNQFGTDVERIPMSFKDFLSSLQNPDGPYHYLTTQYAFEDEEDEGMGAEGGESVTTLPPPTNALMDDFPLVPRLMGNMSLQQVNLWLGKSKDGSSSGLHHDFHDNLYILLSGSKRFVLYPPAEHVNLYPHGTLDTFHPNGLISYKDAPVRSDGLPVRTAAKARVKAIERKLETLAAAGKGKGKGKDKERKKWMDLHDEALDELAKVTLDAVDEEAFGFGDGEEDDFDALMGELDGDDGEDEDGSGSSNRNNAVEDPDEEEEEGSTLGQPDDDESNPESSSEPSSFSRIPTHTLHTHLGLPTTSLPLSSPQAFPNLQKCGKPYVVHLDAGVHMAFNYWFYPPTSKDFAGPYEDALVWEYLKTSSSAEGKDDGAKGGKRKLRDDVEDGRKKAKH
ncbi:hypothetical protein EUX98_g6109 [Antrodiella citrinella]|uniref:Cupin-like domain-containing protein n=1 Tax=Antrodiella citrinella TaxID=2447956 RepID=A0A4S4MRZ7_9APHY|nr:hypothetical protein EUX98_g6109 [Antrodiella citrinella]